MKARIEKHKVTLFDNDYYMSIYSDGDTHTLIVTNNDIKEEHFTTQEQRKFDAMYKSFLAKDYEIVA